MRTSLVVFGLWLLLIAAAACPRAALAHHPSFGTQPTVSGVPPHVDPRFGIISFQPPFAQREPTHPAFQPQPFPPHLIFIESQPPLIFIPGQWVWWESGWVWVPGHWGR